MWEKIKKAGSIAWAIITILVFTIVIILLRRGKADRRGSDGAVEYDSRIQEGLGGAEESIRDSRDTVERCEERLQRAEDILRNAISRSREEQ